MYGSLFQNCEFISHNSYFFCMMSPCLTILRKKVRILRNELRIARNKSQYCKI